SAEPNPATFRCLPSPPRCWFPKSKFSAKTARETVRHTCRLHPPRIFTQKLESPVRDRTSFNPARRSVGSWLGSIRCVADLAEYDSFHSRRRDPAESDER